MLSSPATKTSQLLRLARRGPIRARDLTDARIPRAYLARLVARGELVHTGRGLYRLSDADVTELHSLAEVAARVPRATICLLSALQVHAMTTEAPHAVWIMIDSRARTPKIGTPKIEVVRAHGAAREYGIEKREIEGVPVTITTPAKTVADCFRYRRHVGLDVAIAALRDYLGRSRRRPTRAERAKSDRGDSRFYSVDALVQAARADRVYSVLRPYLEALA